DAFYQTMTTVTTVGFREVEECGTAEKWFTSLIILMGVGTWNMPAAGTCKNGELIA
ncbi:MAG: ion channel, partial [Pseudoxanthomonas sp.]